MGIFEIFKRLVFGETSKPANPARPEAPPARAAAHSAETPAGTLPATRDQEDPGAAPTAVELPAASLPPLPERDSLGAAASAGAPIEPPSSSPATDKETEADPAATPPPAVLGSPDGRERRIKPRVNARPGTKVLIIDDSATIVALLARMLRQNHYDILEAGDAESGLELARAHAPDLIFLDIVLPGMNGFAALRHLRREPATKATPIIMISGNEQATEQFYVQRIGADDFMKKPFSRAEVFARVERLLDEDRVPRRPAASTSGAPAH